MEGVVRDEIEGAHRLVSQTLDCRGVNAATKRARIEGIHSRLTQSLVVHFGVIMMEVFQVEKLCFNGVGDVSSNECLTTDVSTGTGYRKRNIQL